MENTAYRRLAAPQYSRYRSSGRLGRFRVLDVPKVAHGYYWAGNPNAALALGWKHYPPRTYEVEIGDPHRAGDLRHERRENQILGEIKKEKEKKGEELTPEDYKKAHDQMVREGFP